MSELPAVMRNTLVALRDDGHMTLAGELDAWLREAERAALLEPERSGEGERPPTAEPVAPEREALLDTLEGAMHLTEGHPCGCVACEALRGAHRFVLAAPSALGSPAVTEASAALLWFVRHCAHPHGDEIDAKKAILTAALGSPTADEGDVAAVRKWFDNPERALTGVDAALDRILSGSAGGAAPTPEWCVEAFYRVNPGAVYTIPRLPSLYLLDFARAVLRERGGSPGTTAGTPEVSEALQDRLTLHGFVELHYVVDGYEVRITKDDGNTYEAFKGETLREAIDAASRSPSQAQDRP